MRVPTSALNNSVRVSQSRAVPHHVVARREARRGVRVHHLKLHELSRRDARDIKEESEHEMISLLMTMMALFCLSVTGLVGERMREGERLKCVSTIAAFSANVFRERCPAA